MRQAIVIGNLGGNAEIKVNPNTGKKFMSVRLASNEYNFKTKQTDTIWLSLVCNNERIMDSVNKWTKGSTVWASGQYVDGFSLNQDGTLRIDNKTGLPAIERTIYVDSMDWVGGGKSDKAQQTAGGYQAGQVPVQAAPAMQPQPSMAQSYGQPAPQVQPTAAPGMNPPQHQYVNVAPQPQPQPQPMPQLPQQPVATPRYEQPQPQPQPVDAMNDQLPF